MSRYYRCNTPLKCCNWKSGSVSTDCTKLTLCSIFAILKILFYHDFAQLLRRTCNWHTSKKLCSSHQFYLFWVMIIVITSGTINPFHQQSNRLWNYQIIYNLMYSSTFLCFILFWNLESKFWRTMLRHRLCLHQYVYNHSFVIIVCVLFSAVCQIKLLHLIQ